MTFYEPYVQLSTPDVFRMGPRVVNHDLPKFNLDCERRATTALVRRSPLVYALSSQSISHCVKPIALSLLKLMGTCTSMNQTSGRR